MKKIVLALLLGYIALNFPWRIAALTVEVLSMKPGHTRVSDGDDQYWDALDLEAKLIHLGWAVSYEKDLKVYPRGPFGPAVEVYGVTDEEERTIKVDEKLHWNARYAVLAHEAGHTFEPSWADRAQGEAFAEGVAMLVARDGIREHARYIAGNARWEFLFMALSESTAMYNAAALLEDR